MIVLGLGFGDEGKGLTTSHFVSKSERPLVVRFNGGQQAGHTVFYNNRSHVFSNFGSGTLQGAPTLWSHFCSFSPVNYHNERKALGNKSIFIHALSPVTTPYDVVFNQRSEKIKSHGTCGMGFGATIQRHEQHCKLHVQDLFSKTILKQKLEQIAGYYDMADVSAEPFMDLAEELLPSLHVINDYNILKEHTPIFEGAQGLLLDQDFGFFPHVTRSNTSSKNALEIFPSLEVCYVTRTYQTRHGNGPMTNEGLSLNLKNNEQETNVTNTYQGHFRKSVLDLDLLNYSLKCDRHFSKHLKKSLMITCTDQTGELIDVTQNGLLKKINVEELTNHLEESFSSVYKSNGPSHKNISQLR